MLQILDVIRITDDKIKPPGPKMVVCMVPDIGLFYRFNSHSDYSIAVLVPEKPNHPFLSWDSYIEVGETPLQLDEFTVQKAIKSCGGAPLGQVHHSHIPDICAAVQSGETLSVKARNKIISVLQSAVPTPNSAPARPLPPVPSP